MVKLIKKMLLNIYNGLTSHYAVVSIGDIMNMRGNLGNNQFLTVTRLMDVEDYCDRGIKGFYWQNTVSRKAYGEKHEEEKGNKEFEELIESYKEKGYDESSVFTLDADGRLLDGNHRMGLNIYYGVNEVKARIVKRHITVHDKLDWYFLNGIDTEYINSVIKRYEQVQRKLVDSGCVFSLVLTQNTDLKGCEMLINIKNTVNYSSDKEICFDGITFPKDGVLIQFTLSKPEYYYKKGEMISKRAEEIENVISKRIGKETNFYISKNCKFGKMVFDRLSGGFVPDNN